MSERKKFKIERSLGIELPGLGKLGALENRNYPPAQRDRIHKRKSTRFGVQLREKQKLLFHYDLREEQLRRFVRKGRSLNSSNWIESLIGLLERRLDNIVFRLGFAHSIAAAFQLVSHGHILVNGRRERRLARWCCIRVRWFGSHSEPARWRHFSFRSSLITPGEHEQAYALRRTHE